MIDKKCHHVVWQGAIPRDGAALGIDGILGVGKVVQEVEGFDAGNELAFQEGLREGGVEHEVIGVEVAAAIATAAEHVAVGRKRGI